MLFFGNNIVPNYPMYIYFKRINRAIEFVIVHVKSIKCCISELGYCRIIVRSKEINNLFLILEYKNMDRLLFYKTFWSLYAKKVPIKS